MFFRLSNVVFLFFMLLDYPISQEIASEISKKYKYIFIFYIFTFCILDIIMSVNRKSHYKILRGFV